MSCPEGEIYPDVESIGLPEMDNTANLLATFKDALGKIKRKYLVKIEHYSNLRPLTILVSLNQ
jgi:hypothetical protein